MTHLALARKWRPKNFEALVGQTHVSQALINALKNQRLHHAYLFTGTRGVGKTTIARILAKSLNCEKGISATPCGQCHTCLEIDRGSFVDLIEIDAASRTKVEDTRELLDNVQYTPTKGRYKVYLIDEVHMLSTHSFNALLKTLEEPPEHVIFLLATTDPQKLPVTVLSRCLQFYLKKLSKPQITEQLKTILSAEKIHFDEAALSLLAQAAKGSLRDALSLTDQAIAFCENNITLEPIQQMLGCVSQEHLWDLFSALNENSNEALLTVSQALEEQGADFEQVLDSLITQLQYIILYQQAPEAIQYDDLAIEKLNHFAESFDAETLQLYYQIALIARRDLPLSPDSKLGFDLFLLRLTTFTPNGETNTTPITAKKTAPKPTEKPANAPVKTDNWSQLIDTLKLTGITKTLLENTSLLREEKGLLVLSVSADYSPMVNDKHISRIETALTEHYQAPTKVRFETGDTQNTPAAQKQQHKVEKQSNAVKSIEHDESVQALMNAFDAKVIPEAIKAK